MKRERQGRGDVTTAALPEEIVAIVRRTLAEDIGDGDVTSECILSPDVILWGEFVAKADGVLAGLTIARAAFQLTDPRIIFTPLAEDGAVVTCGQRLATVEGPGVGILSAERTALNFLQRMSGIATLTRRYVNAVAGTGAVILDTRKTAPGLRPLDKWAVRLGGGHNHRMGLYDMVLIKDNHIAAAGGITTAVQRVRAYDTHGLFIEVEAKTLAELEEALAIEPPLDRIMLDNMSLEEMRQAVTTTASSVPLEASGGVTLETVGEIAATGVDYISVGALTHSAQALDISLEVEVHVGI
ncbi:MAG: carboxylating nicotinate-nucleotide diphosphorylase [Chloroflexi bacterium]|nr:carboxylating nicotinate-nucleotide diphosphorylase [Chloroflexota bacterium]